MRLFVLSFPQVDTGYHTGVCEIEFAQMGKSAELVCMNNMGLTILSSLIRPNLCFMLFSKLHVSTMRGSRNYFQRGSNFDNVFFGFVFVF